MEKKQAIVVGIVLVAILGLFVIVYAQLSAKPVQAPAGMVNAPQNRVVPPQMKSGAAAGVPMPVAKDPQTIEEVAQSIADQLDQDAASAQADMEGKVSGVSAQVNSANDLNQTYDPNQY
jgi:hypothetical protein